MEEKINILLDQGHLSEAIDELMKITYGQQIYKDIILLSNRLNPLENEKRLKLYPINPPYITQLFSLYNSILETKKLINFKIVKSTTKLKRNVESILFLGANPTNTTQERLAEEVREIDTELRLGKKRNSLHLEQRWAVTTATLRRALLRFESKFIHFSGHGEIAGIILEDQNGEAKLVPSDALADMISIFADNVECVILNACYSESQAKSIIQHIPYVIGMSTAVPDASAIKFAAGFYGDIANGWAIEKSFKLGKASVAADGLEKDMILLLKKDNSSAGFSTLN
jgi:hypothetical protein